MCTLCKNFLSVEPNFLSLECSISRDLPCPLTGSFQMSCQELALQTGLLLVRNIAPPHVFPPSWSFCFLINLFFLIYILFYVFYMVYTTQNELRLRGGYRNQTNKQANRTVTLPHFQFLHLITLTLCVQINVFLCEYSRRCGSVLSQLISSKRNLIGD